MHATKYVYNLYSTSVPLTVGGLSAPHTLHIPSYGPGYAKQMKEKTYRHIMYIILKMLIFITSVFLFRWYCNLVYRLILNSVLSKKKVRTCILHIIKYKLSFFFKARKWFIFKKMRRMYRNP